MARPQVLSFPWISGRFRALTCGKGTFEKQKEFSEAPSPSKGLLGAFEEAVKGDPWRTGPTTADLASANYRTKVLERENTALRAALAEAVSLYGRPGGPWNVPSDPGGWLARARAALAAAALGHTADAPDQPDDLTILRERISRLWMKGYHQTWCGLFGEKVGWDDALIHKIEPFVAALVRQIADELREPTSDGERGRYTSAMRHAGDLRKLVGAKEATIAEKDAQLAEAAKQLAAAKVLIADDAKQIAEIHAMVERRVTELLASNNALLERARRAEAALRPFVFDLESTKDDDDQVALLTCRLGHIRAAASVIAQIEGSAP